MMSKYKVLKDNLKNVVGEEFEKTLPIIAEEYEAKIRRQAAEITRLLAENKELKWEKAKGEIKAGDVVSREGLYGVVKSVSDDWLNGITASGISFQWLKCKCTKTGRHIDIDSFLKQIGGGQE